MTPKVQSLAEIMAELAPASSQQTGIVQQQRAGLDTKYAGQEAGLEAQKAQGFNVINRQAARRGATFSGIPLDEQATYLSTNYLPAVANLRQQKNTEDIALQGQLADINANQFKTAYGVQQGQTSALNQWNLTQMQQEAAAAEAEKNRQFEASQNAQNRAATAALNSAKSGNQAWQLGGSAGSGYTVFNTDGSRANVDLWTYVRGNGGSQSDLVNLLAKGDKNDRKAANNYAQNVDKYGPAAAFAQLQRDASTAFYTSK